MTNHDAFFMLTFMEKPKDLHPNAGINSKDHETINLYLRSFISKCYLHSGSDSLSRQPARRHGEE